MGVIGFTGKPSVAENHFSDYSRHVIINPEVERLAQVRIVEQEGFKYWDANGIHAYYAVRYTVEVTPKDGGKSYRIIKTLDGERCPCCTPRPVRLLLSRMIWDNPSSFTYSIKFEDYEIDDYIKETVQMYDLYDTTHMLLPGCYAFTMTVPGNRHIFYQFEVVEGGILRVLMDGNIGAEYIE